MKNVIRLFIFLIVTTASAQEVDSFFSQADAFFKTYISKGRVDYAKVKANPATLNALLSKAETTKISKSDSKVYQSFWINAYNLSVIKGIVAKYPISSPLKISGFFDKITYTIAGEAITLNDIENMKLRASFPEEPRFHFALVCAGLGCPPIISEAYVPLTLEKQLQQQTKIALNNPHFIKISQSTVQLSQIFEWYTEDFIRNGTLRDFLNLYRDTPIAQDATLSYYPYDWTLNDIR